MQPTIGTVSHGTLRPQDLLPAFLDCLGDIAGSDEYAAAAYQQLTCPGAGFPAVPAYALEDDEAEFWKSDADDLISDLIDTLNEYAPPYCYFGAHPGDGSDFGYWPDFDALDEINHVSDPSELDSMGGHEAVHVNDHGNVTLYARDGDEWGIVWEIV